MLGAEVPATLRFQQLGDLRKVCHIEQHRHAIVPVLVKGAAGQLDQRTGNPSMAVSARREDLAPVWEYVAVLT